jgi:hypothetical protein
MTMIYELLNAQVRLGMITLEQRDALLAEFNALLDEPRPENGPRGRAFLMTNPNSRLQQND